MFIIMRATTAVDTDGNRITLTLGMIWQLQHAAANSCECSNKSHS